MLRLLLCLSVAAAVRMSDSLPPALGRAAEDEERDIDRIAAALRGIAPDGPSQLGSVLARAVHRACGTADEEAAVREALVSSLGGGGGDGGDDGDDGARPAKRQRLAIAAGRDVETGARLLRNIRHFFAGPLRSPGTRPAVLQQKADTIAECLYSRDIVDDSQLSSMERLTGMNRAQFQRGGLLQSDNAARPRNDQLPGTERARREDYVDLDWVWSWFHSQSPDVEPDKSTKWAYKRKRAFVAGKMRDLKCEMRILKCGKAEAVQNFKNSEEYKRFVREHDTELHDNIISGCICPCMKADKREECACPICTAFMHRLKAWHAQRAQWHATGSCNCALDCKNAGSQWRQASVGFNHFESCILCPRRQFSGLELPHAPKDPPEFYDLACCLQPRANGNQYPEAVPPCGRCGWAQKFGSGRCADEYNDSAATWKRPTEIDAGKGRSETRFVEHTGTRAELLAEIEGSVPEFLYHRWIRMWMKWQFKLDIATFNGRHEILILTDFAAIYEMKGKEVGNSEHGISSHQLVALVLHSPAPMARNEGEEREVKCDYWRIWSNKKGDAAFHDKAMREIAEYYRSNGIVPELRRLKIWSDGQRAQYKGRKNFGRMAEWPKPKADGGLELESWHNFFVSHHASGPQDNAGKDPRRKMDRAIIKDKDKTIYSYAACNRWCVENMAAPSAEHEHRGTFGCNGEYHWRAYSDGADANPDGYPVIDARPRDWHAIEGSNERYAFRSWNTEPTQPELEHFFVPCYCRASRAGAHDECPFRNITQAPMYDFVRPKNVPARRRNARRAASAHDSSSDSD